MRKLLSDPGFAPRHRNERHDDAGGKGWNLRPKEILLPKWGCRPVPNASPAQMVERELGTWKSVGKILLLTTRQQRPTQFKKMGKGPDLTFLQTFTNGQWAHEVSTSLTTRRLKIKTAAPQRVTPARAAATENRESGSWWGRGDSGPLCSVRGDVKRSSRGGKNWDSFSKEYGPVTPLPDIHAKELKSVARTVTCSPRVRLVEPESPSAGDGYTPWGA